MKKTRILALLLAVMLLLALFTACGNSSAPAAEEPAAEEPAAEPAAPAAEPAAPAAEPAAPEGPPAGGPPAEEPAAPDGPPAGEAPAEGPAAPAGDGDVLIQFGTHEEPLPVTEEEVTYTCWQGDPVFIYSFTEPIGKWPDEINVSWNYLAEVTGVHMDWILTADPPTDLNIRAASGDLPDLFISGAGWYVGGEARGIEEGIFMILDDYLDQMPNYKEIIDSNESLRRDIVNNEGHIGSIWAVFDNYGGMAPNGPLVRADWLEEFGLTPDDVRTYDQYHDYLTQAKAAHDAMLFVPYSGVPDDNWLIGGYGIAGEYTSEQQTYPFYQENGTVKFGPLEPAYRDYLEMISQWYSEGLISDHLINFTTISNPDNEYVASGAVSMFHWNAGNLGQLIQLSGDPNMAWIGIRDAVFPGDEDSLTQFGVNSKLAAFNMQVSPDCHDLDVLWRWANFGYTKEGSYIWQYGKEGDTYTMVDGEPIYTEKITQGMPLGIAEIAFLATSGGPYVSHAGRLNPYYEDYVVNSWNTWLESTDYDNTKWLPSTLTLLNEDTTEFSNLMADITTYMDENIPQFIMGDKSLDEFDGFVEWLENMGIEDCIAMKQRAYDAYLAK